MPKSPKFNFFGSCVSSDAFQITGNRPLIQRRVSRMSIHSLTAGLAHHDSFSNFLKSQNHWEAMQVHNDCFSKKIRLPKDSILVIDLLGEAWNILSFGSSDALITNSDYFRDFSSKFGGNADYSSLPELEFAFKRGSEFEKVLWKKNCHKFKDFVNSLNVKVILHECYFATHYKQEDDLIEWPEDQDKIAFNNDLFRYYHQIFKEIVQPDIVIKVRDDYRVIDMQHHWGAFITHYIGEYYKDFILHVSRYFPAVKPSAVLQRTFDRRILEKNDTT